MANTVDDLRNEIRQSVGRFERQESTQFTKETLVAISETVGQEIDGGRRPSKPEMRADIARLVQGVDEDRDHERAFRKAELQAIVRELTAE